MLFITLTLASVLSLGLAIDETRTFEVMVPCRDGVQLHTRVVLPKDYEGKRFTTVIDRSPYGYTDLEWMSDLFVPFGFAAIGQDMRGTCLSEGNFTIWHGDADDSEDLGNWIVQQSWSNGKVFGFGASADGLAAFTTNYNEPSWLASQYFIWTSSIGYEVIYPNGAYLFNLVDRWIKGTVPNEADSCLQTIWENESPKGDWWTPIEFTGQYDLVHTNSGFWAGWYDIFLVGTLAAYQGFNNECDAAHRQQSLITIDPLGHCQAGAEYFSEDLIAGRTLLALMQAYQVYGIHPVERTNVKNVTFYVMSSNDEAGRAAGQYWSSLEYFPTPKMTAYYAHADGSASTDKPTESGSSTDSSTYVYDPTNPVPTMGGNNLFCDCGPLDQATIDTRDDVLTFQTAVFAEELPLTGPLLATLYVGSDAVDTDFMVRISDVYPTGEVRLIQDSAARMRWREGGAEPVLMSGDKAEVYEITMSIWNTSYVVAPGHALRFAVTSSNYPRFGINRNNGVALAAADQGANITANNVFYHSAKYPSHFDLPVVRKVQIPELHGIKEQFQKAYPQIDADKLIAKEKDGKGFVSGLIKKIMNRFDKK